jgi:hypothetical protein
MSQETLPNLTWSIPRYPNARRLMTPILYNVESERPEAVFEELSGNEVFRSAPAPYLQSTCGQTAN